MPHTDEHFVKPPSVVWIAGTLLGAWANGLLGSGFAPVGYYKDTFGIVRLRGLPTGGVIGTAIITLPVGYRPEFRQLIATESSGAHGVIDLRTNGDVIASIGAAAQFSLDSVSFRALPTQQTP